METSPRTIPHPTSPCHQASNSRQPASSSSSSFTIRTDDRFVITRESDILYTLRVIEKRLLSMHCGLPWWREEGVISKGTRYATIHIFSNTRVEATRVAQRVEAMAVLPVYETQYTWPLSILRSVCRQQLTRGAQSADRERGTRYTRAQDGVI